MNDAVTDLDTSGAAKAGEGRKIDQSLFETVVGHAALAPSVHNTQPARFRNDGDEIVVLADTSVALPVADPDLRDMGLSLGAAVEAAVLALSQNGHGATVENVWDPAAAAALRPAAIIRLAGQASLDVLAKQLPLRFTWRDTFASGTPNLFGWTPSNALLVTDHPGKAWIATANDEASLRVMRGRGFRRELLGWMRLKPRHPRYALDGMNTENLHLTDTEARIAPIAMGAAFGLLDRVGVADGLVAEADKTRSAQLIAIFHRPLDESPIDTGRAYLRLWLEATKLGFAGWPMAALTHDAQARDALCARYALPDNREIVQVLRFGRASGVLPPRARLPLTDLIV